MWYNNDYRNIKNFLIITVSSLLPPILRSDVIISANRCSKDYISQSCITIAKLKVFVIVVHVSRGQLQENQHVKDSHN